MWEILRTEQCKAMDFGGTKKVISILESGRSIRLTDMAFTLLKLVIIRV
jgi:hypothetical protein